LCGAVWKREKKRKEKKEKEQGETRKTAFCFVLKNKTFSATFLFVF